jgi:7-cyano-7-deazaguanine synthase
MESKRALIVFSGGQDSTTCLFWAIENYGRGNVSAIGFDYGQRHKLELEYAKNICSAENISYYIMDISLLGQLAPNALTRTDMQIDGTEYEHEYPNTFVEGRNHIFFSFAAIYAKQRAISDIITGVSETDFSGYPDCRDIFIKSLNVTLNLAMDYNFSIIAPLMRLDKAQVWALADKLGCIDIIKDKTLTCYGGIAGDGCAKCPACILRLRGYEKYLKEKMKER